MNIVKKVDIGNVREINQDYAGFKKINDHEAFLVVCDGMGGHQAGEIASLMTAEYILKHCEMLTVLDTEHEIKIWMHHLINNANKEVYEKSITEEQLKGMGTTVVLAYIKGNMLYVVHVGDSRAYVISDKIEQLTTDDTLVNALVNSGTITKEEALYHPKKNILLQAIGVSTPLKISFYTKELHNESVFLCSDGLYNSISDELILSIINSSMTIEEKADYLLLKAKEYGGFDNIGFVLAMKEEV